MLTALPRLLLLGAVLASPAWGAGEGEDLRAIIRRVEKQYWSSSSHGTMRMEVVTRNWRRSLLLEAWSRGDEEFLVRILEPAKDRGVATLKSGEDIWNYLPRVDRTIKIPSSLMGEGWMGSHLTNDDLVKESRVERDYDFSLLERRRVEGETRLVIEAVPRPEAAVVWGRIVYEIGEELLLPRETVYYDEEGRERRRMRFGQVRDLGGKRLPTRVEVTPLDKPGEETVMTYLEMAFDVPLPAGFFSLANLGRQ
jgi:hypothetical protein